MMEVKYYDARTYLIIIGLSNGELHPIDLETAKKFKSQLDKMIQVIEKDDH